MIMARKKSEKKSRSSKRVQKRASPMGPSAWWRLSDNEYTGIVAVVALFLIAAIVLKGPALLRGDSAVVGQAYSAPVVETSGVDHVPPEYVPPEDWNEGAVVTGQQEAELAVAADW